MQEDGTATPMLKPTKTVFCTYCGHAFTRDEHLERHILTHTQVKPYKCEHCHMSFARRDLLQRHWQIHGKAQDADGHPIQPPNPPKTAGRTPIACSNCAKNKTKCDRQTPCGRCQARGLQCTVRDGRRQSKAAVRQAREAQNRSDSDQNSVGDVDMPQPFDIHATERHQDTTALENKALTPQSLGGSESQASETDQIHSRQSSISQMQLPAFPTPEEQPQTFRFANPQSEHASPTSPVFGRQVHGSSHDYLGTTASNIPTVSGPASPNVVENIADGYNSGGYWMNDVGSMDGAFFPMDVMDSTDDSMLTQFTPTSHLSGISPQAYSILSSQDFSNAIFDTNSYTSDGVIGRGHDQIKDCAPPAMTPETSGTSSSDQSMSPTEEQSQLPHVNLTVRPTSQPSVIVPGTMQGLVSNNVAMLPPQLSRMSSGMSSENAFSDPSPTRPRHQPNTPPRISPGQGRRAEVAGLSQRVNQAQSNMHMAVALDELPTSGQINPWLLMNIHDQFPLDIGTLRTCRDMLDNFIQNFESHQARPH